MRRGSNMALMRRKNNRKLASADVEGGHQQTERDHTSTQLQGRGWTLGTLGKSVFVCIIILCLLAYHSLRTSPVDREKLEKQRLYEERQREAERNRLAPGSPDDPVWENGHYVHNHKYNKEQYTISSTDDDGDDAKITVVDSPDIKRIKRKRSDVLERRLRRGNLMQPSEIEELQELKKELDGETVDINALEGIDAKDPYKLDPILRSPPPRKRKENDADTQIDNADVILSGIGVNAAQQSAAAELSDQELRELFSAPAETSGGAGGVGAVGEMNAIEVTHRNNRPLHPTAEQEDHSFDAVFNVMEELDHIEP